MDKKTEFTRTLERLRKMAREQGNLVSEQQVREAFASLELEDGQLQLVFDYLKGHAIGLGEPLSPEDTLTEDENDYLETYLEQLRRTPQVTDGEREALSLSAMAGETDAQRRLAELYLPQVAEIARLYAGQGVWLEDLIGEGNVALTAGVTLLGCLEHVSEVPGMLGKMMMDAMEEYIADNAEESKISAKVAARINRVADSARRLSGELCRKVTVEELERDTRLTRTQILDAMRMSGGRIEDIDDGK